MKRATRYILLVETLVTVGWGSGIWLSGWNPVRGELAVFLFLFWLCSCVLGYAFGVVLADSMSEGKKG